MGIYESSTLVYRLLYLIGFGLLKNAWSIVYWLVCETRSFARRFVGMNTYISETIRARATKFGDLGQKGYITVEHTRLVTLLLVFFALIERVWWKYIYEVVGKGKHDQVRSIRIWPCLWPSDGLSRQDNWQDKQGLAGSQLHVVYADNYFGLVHRYPFKLSGNPTHYTHTHTTVICFYGTCVRVCASVCGCVRVCVGCAVEDMHTSVGRTVYPVYKLQQHVSTHSRKGSWGRERLKRPLYNYFRLLQTNPASKTAAAVAAMAAMATTMARTMTGRRRVYAILALAYYWVGSHRIRIHWNRSRTEHKCP